MAKHYKMICCDLDGTLLNEKSEISEYNAEVLRKARDMGAVICFVSGRPYFDIFPFCKQVGISFPVAYSNGACVYDPKTDLHWLENFLPADDTMDFIRHCRKIGCDWSITAYNKQIIPKKANKYIWSDEGYKETVKKYNAMGLTPPMRYNLDDEEVYDFLKEGVSEISVEYKPDDDSVTETVALVDKYFESTPCGLVSKKVDNNMRDITNAKCDKWNAVLVIAQKLGIGTDEICVFGDNMNDLTMIKECKTSFAMANGDERVFPYATAVIDTNVNDGVGKAIEKYILDYIG